ncbi:MAG: hypothetical protein ABSB40_07450 [Nitrososphaeria archaeon]|jgi:hypothetical protein
MSIENNTCAICSKEKVLNGQFCEHHNIAYHKIEGNYGYWKEAYEELSWEAYLKLTIDNPENGVWVKEVAKYLITKKSEDLNV